MHKYIHTVIVTNQPPDALPTTIAASLFPPFSPFSPGEKCKKGRKEGKGSQAGGVGVGPFDYLLFFIHVAHQINLEGEKKSCGQSWYHYRNHIDNFRKYCKQ